MKQAAGEREGISYGTLQYSLGRIATLWNILSITLSRFAISCLIVKVRMAVFYGTLQHSLRLSITL